MALNRPTAIELLDAVVEFLEADVAPQVAAATAFHLRVARNVIGIVQREIKGRDAMDANEHQRLQALLGSDASRLSLNLLLADRISAGQFDAEPARTALFKHLTETIAGKLAIDNPSYGHLP